MPQFDSSAYNITFMDGFMAIFFFILISLISNTYTWLFYNYFLQFRFSKLLNFKTFVLLFY